MKSVAKIPTAGEINEARKNMWRAMSGRNRATQPTPERLAAHQAALENFKAKRISQLYDYRPVECLDCGWRGKRGFNVMWCRCPRCSAHAERIQFVRKSDAGREPYNERGSNG